LLRAACSGGTGNDLCIAQGASNWTTGTIAARNSSMTCTGGPGNDTLWTLNGVSGDRINGGGQKGDICFADATDTVTGCGQTLRWRVSAADLKLIDGTPSQRAQFVRNSIATINNQRVPAATVEDLTEQFDSVTRQLEQAIVKQNELLRDVMNAAH
jgi:hypothetical protein